MNESLQDIDIKEWLCVGDVVAVLPIMCVLQE